MSKAPDRYDPVVEKDFKQFANAWANTGLSIDQAMLCFGMTPWEKERFSYITIISLAFKVVESPRLIMPKTELQSLNYESMQIAQEAKISSKYYEAKLKRNQLAKLKRKMKFAEDRIITRIIKAFPMLCEDFRRNGKSVIGFIPAEKPVLPGKSGTEPGPQG